MTFDKQILSELTVGNPMNAFGAQEERATDNCCKLQQEAQPAV